MVTVASDTIKIEVEITMYQVKPTNKKWYEFWKKKTVRKIMNSDFNDGEATIKEVDADTNKIL